MLHLCQLKRDVIPWLDHGIQLKILKLLVFLLFLWTPWSSYGVTQWILPIHATMLLLE
ncbi:hypothetical protein [Candidatus Rickettsia kedanie]|uniref:hypothetical protein n=1 Tax=Candidatus Rickettsia kedanie TaxID=3115352 RepID=UPI00399CDD23